MKRILDYLICAAACSLLAVGCAQPKGNKLDFDYESLNARALEESLVPVHPGSRGEVPFWNKYSFKFTYAPAFDFDDVEGATGYTYVAETGGQFFIFADVSPRASLAEIWEELPAGDIHLSLQAHDGQGEQVGEPQVRDFKKDTPFHGPYEAASEDYAGAALRAAEYIHSSPIGQLWLKGAEPDLERKCTDNQTSVGAFSVYKAARAT